MVRATLIVKSRPGCEPELERVWHEIAAAVREQPGVLRQTLLRHPEDGSTFVITSDWESREAFRRFEQSEEQHELTRPLRELRESVSMEVLDVVEHVE